MHIEIRKMEMNSVLRRLDRFLASTEERNKAEQDKTLSPIILTAIRPETLKTIRMTYTFRRTLWKPDTDPPNQINVMLSTPSKNEGRPFLATTDTIKKLYIMTDEPATKIVLEAWVPTSRTTTSIFVFHLFWSEYIHKDTGHSHLFPATIREKYMDLHNEHVPYKKYILNEKGILFLYFEGEKEHLLLKFAPQSQ
jgi:hypothetical protein